MATVPSLGLPTTVIGAYPKPGYVPVSDWFHLPDRDYAGRWADEMEAAGEDAEASFVRAAAEVIADQVAAPKALAAVSSSALTMSGRSARRATS